MRIVGTTRKQGNISISVKTRIKQGRKVRTHHQPLDVLHARLLDALAQKQHADTGPHEQQYAKRRRDKPVKRQKVEGAAEDDVERRRVDDENAQACASEDAREVVVVSDNRLAEREAELRLNSEDL